ncbi:hypothetical protein [uncultured Pontibacter sp.]|uniref:hypothetical protein n=1 Tax=uncultured Pontibacter sp. TaxID=453356 RepID=UPI0026361BFA|nr:hypothetical protein [uncultured Pontibacter sp.]
MKQLVTLVVALVMFAGTALAQTTVDKELKQLLQATTSVSLGVVVTFYGDGAPTPANLSLLTPWASPKELRLNLSRLQVYWQQPLK